MEWQERTKRPFRKMNTKTQARASGYFPIFLSIFFLVFFFGFGPFSAHSSELGSISWKPINTTAISHSLPQDFSIFSILTQYIYNLTTEVHLVIQTLLQFWTKKTKVFAHTPSSTKLLRTFSYASYLTI